ncbi:MAG: PTS sugar transporter subunit IIA [Planctomycetota bacterium]|jgi:mannitol/fructose-specific phosphotransferase system IIA component (Ntr-type)
MRLPELLSAQDLVLPLSAGDKWDAITRLVDHTVEQGNVRSELRDEVLELVLARERSMSTGMEKGIAIPHAAVDGLDRIVGSFGVVTAEEGLAFEAIDARPTYLVVLLLIPRAQKLQHIRTLNSIAQILRSDATRTALRDASDVDAAWAILDGADQG